MIVSEGVITDIERGGSPECGRPPESWEDFFVQKVLRDLPPDASVQAKADAMWALVAKLQALREFERWDPRNPDSVVLKRDYREVERLEGHTAYVCCLQALPDGRIVLGGADKTICIWTKSADGVWGSEEVGGHTAFVYCLQALPDGRIVSGSYDNTIRIWTKSADGSWGSEVVGGHTNRANCLQVLPDGRIISGGDDRTIRIFDCDELTEAPPRGFVGRLLQKMKRKP